MPSTIGDLFFGFHGDDKQLQVDATKAGAKAGTSMGSQMTANLKKSWSGANIGKGLVQGLGMAGGLGAMSVFSSAISGVIGVLGDATAAAIADQESVARLSASLKANVPAWDGNTDAIEANITAKQRLGFDDETLRDSLTVLAGATNDVTEAQNIQNVAMDLARFKGIDLKTASEALIKVEGGVYRSLKQLGIKLKDNATSTEALAAVQAVASGQAEAYADTNAGKLAASQIKVDEAMERFGAVTMPLVTEAVVTASDAIEDIVDEIAELDKGLEPLGGVGGTLATTIELLAGMAGAVRGDPTVAQKWAANWVASAEQVSTGVGKAADDVIAGSGKMKDDLLVSSAVGVSVIDNLGGALDRLHSTAVDKNGKTAKSFSSMVDSLVGDAERAISDAFDPTIEAYKQLELNSAEAAAEVALNTGTATAAEKAALAEARKAQALHLLEMTKAGQTTSKAYTNGLKDLEANAKSSSGATKRALDKVIATIKEVKRVGKYIPLRFAIGYQGTGPDGAGPAGQLASGGPAVAGNPYWVNEETPRTELFVPSVSGYVLTHNDAMAAASASVPGSSGGGNTYIVNAQGLIRARSADEIGASLRRLADFGVLDPAAYGEG